MSDEPAIYTVKPVLIELAYGGWLAVTPRGWPLSVGVTAATVGEATVKFEEAMERWSKIGEPAQHPEATCEKCSRKNISWFVASELWNKYARTDDSDPMLCPVCFVKQAAAAGFDYTWELRPDPEMYPGPTAAAQTEHKGG